MKSFIKNQGNWLSDRVLAHLTWAAKKDEYGNLEESVTEVLTRLLRVK